MVDGVVDSARRRNRHSMPVAAATIPTTAAACVHTRPFVASLLVVKLLVLVVAAGAAGADTALAAAWTHTRRSGRRCCRCTPC